MLVRSQHLATISILIHGTLSHEDCIIIALTEDEGSQNDIDNIELHTEQSHNTQYPQPTHCHRDK